MKFNLLIVFLCTVCLFSCKNPTELDDKPIIHTEAPAKVVVKPIKVDGIGRHIINSNNDKPNIQPWEITRYRVDSAVIDTSGAVPSISLKGECLIVDINSKPPQPNLLNAALQSIIFRIDSLPLYDNGCELRKSPMNGSGIVITLKKSIIRRDGVKDPVRDTSSQSIIADGSLNANATARFVKKPNSNQNQRQYMVEITFNYMIEIEREKNTPVDVFPIIGKVFIYVNY